MQENFIVPVNFSSTKKKNIKTVNPFSLLLHVSTCENEHTMHDTVLM